MNSRRILKKKISSTVNNIIEECYTTQLSNGGERNDETVRIIDEAQSIFNELLERVQAVKGVSDNTERRKLYEAINSDLEKASLELLGRLNKV